jgi:hypothetical protein
MDIQKIIADLREQLGCVEQAIVALEKIAGQQSPRRGRPPKRLSGATKTSNVTSQVAHQAVDAVLD